MNEIYSKYATDYAKAIEDNIYNTLYDRPSLLALIEGVPSEKIKEKSEKLYEKLTTFPQFIFVRAKKI